MPDLSRIRKACRTRGLVALGLVLALLLVPSGAAFASPLAPAFRDDMESGPAQWVVDIAIPLGSSWDIVTTNSNSPTHSYFTDDPTNISDKRVRFANPVTIGAGQNLSFFMRWNVETGFDGIVLEYSFDNATWTDILAANGGVPADPARITQTPYTHTISVNFQSPIAGRRAWSADNLAFQQVRVNTAAFVGQPPVRFRWRFASDNSVPDVGVWLDDVVIAANLEPIALVVDAPPGNRVMEPNETAAMAPSWQNTTTGAIAATGALSNFAGPAGATYAIVDGTGSYGTIAAGAIAPCTDCYSVSATAATRPVTHWDATVLETITPGAITKSWTLHIGGSFADVPTSNPFYRFIETLLHRGVTGGCSATDYCPGNSTTREQMAVFVLVAKEPPGYLPPACTPPNLFLDVPETSPFCRWIEELANRGVVAGCTANTYCPGNPVTREQMAVFALRTLDPALNPPACAPPNLFLDVPDTSPFCKWIEEMANRGIVSGCGGNNYCPTDPVTREQMGVFLSVTFSLVLYGV